MLERWTWDSNGRGLESWPLAGNNLGQVVYTHLPLSRSSIIWYWSVGGDSLQLGRSGVTLVMRHRLQWCIHLRTHGLRMGDEHPPTLVMWYRALYPLRWEDRITWHWLHRPNMANKRVHTKNIKKQSKRNKQWTMFKLEIKITDNAGDRNLWVSGMFCMGRSGVGMSGLGVFEETGIWLCH